MLTVTFWLLKKSYSWRRKKIMICFYKYLPKLFTSKQENNNLTIKIIFNFTCNAFYVTRKSGTSKGRSCFDFAELKKIQINIFIQICYSTVIRCIAGGFFQSWARNNSFATTGPCLQAIKLVFIAIVLYLMWLLYINTEI